MPVLDNAIWLTGTGSTAANGTTVINDGGSSTTVTGTFTPNAWDASQSGQNVSQFGAFGISSDINANFGFSEPVTDLSFNLEHVSASGSTYDDLFVLRFYDENGDLIPAAVVMAGITGMTHTNVYANPDGSVSVEADGTAPDTINISLAGPISEVDITFGPGPDGIRSGGAGFDDFVFSVPAVVCFARDTQIETKDGLILIQDLKVGDLVRTRDNGYQPIRWIGSQDVHAKGALAPVVISAGTLGNSTDLLVSQQHRILITGWQAELLFAKAECLAVAKHLVNGETIYLAPQKSIQYHHILFENHEIIYANGVPSESFHPNVIGLGSIDTQAREEIYTLFPALRNDIACYGSSVHPTLKSHESSLLSFAA